MEGKEEMFYCPICGLPPDFCQYGPSWEKCNHMSWNISRNITQNFRVCHWKMHKKK